jgi:hypothetical protein
MVASRHVRDDEGASSDGRRDRSATDVRLGESLEGDRHDAGASGRSLKRDEAEQGGDEGHDKGAGAEGDGRLVLERQHGAVVGVRIGADFNARVNALDCGDDGFDVAHHELALVIGVVAALRAENLFTITQGVLRIQSDAADVGFAVIGFEQPLPRKVSGSGKKRKFETML